MSLGFSHKRLFSYVHYGIQRAVTLVVVCVLVFSDITPMLQWPPAPPALPKAEAASPVAIKVESFDQDVTTDGSTFTLNNDVGATSSAFIRINTGTRKTSAGPTGSTADTGPNVGTVGLVLTDTATVTVERVNSTAVKVMGEVWRYEGPVGGGNEFIVRDRLTVNLTGSSQSTALSGISDTDKVIPFITGYTVNDSSVSNWEAATIATHVDDSGNLIVSRNNSGAAATVYVDVVEFTGSEWTVCHGHSNSHDTAEQVITLNTDSDGQGGSTCDVGDWGEAAIIEATMEGDTTETGLSDTLALVRPGTTTTSIIFDLQQDTGARNDGEAWIHVLQNDGLVVNRASSTDLTEGNGTYGTATWPTGATTSASLDTLSLEWFPDTSGVGTAHMRGGLHARITGEIVYNDGDLVSSADYDSTIEGNFEGEMTFAASPSGVIYEAGGTGTGSFVGYNDSGDFIIRAGNGGSTAPADAARIVITSSDYDFSNRTGTLSWNFYPATEAVDLAFDEDSNGSIDYSTSTTAASAWANWSGGNDGNVGNSNGNIAGSEITSGYNFNGTIDEVRFSQGYDVTHWIHRSGNTVGVDYGVIELSGLAAVTEDAFVTATGTHAATSSVPAIDNYLGGTFVIEENTGSRNVTNIVLTESGSIDAQNALDNIELYYEYSTSSPHDCSEDSYDGDEDQFGDTDDNGFSGANGVSSFNQTGVTISTTQSLCLYVIYDVTDQASDGDTISVSIDDPSSDITVTGGGSVGPASTVAPTGSTTIRSAELTQTRYRWLNDDGAEGSATAIENENTAAIGFSTGVTRRLRLQVDAAGSITSNGEEFRLEYGTSTGSCVAVSNWEDVGASGGAWDMSASSFITDGTNATDIATTSGGVSNPSGQSFETVNTGLRDTNSQTATVTLAANEFTEFEFAVAPTVNAVEGNTYCFRLTDEGTALRNYDVYAEGTVSADIDVSASSSQVTSLDASTTDQYVGGTFVIERPGTVRTITGITISETGSVDATKLLNPRLYYDLDTTSPYDCTGESYAGSDTSISGTAFSGPNGTTSFTGSILASSTQALCGYIVFDVSSTTSNGETITIEITDPSVDVAVTSSSVGPSTPVSPTGSTTIAGPVLTLTHYHWRNDDGDETDSGATSATGGNEDTTLLQVPKNTTQRLRLQVSNEGTVTSKPTQYRLEYGTKVTSCSAVASWQQVGVGVAFATSASAFISDGNTTDIDNAANGAMTEENTTLVGTGALRETSSESGTITLTSTEYTELEYSIEATEFSGFDTNYCFRVTDSGSPLLSYSRYPELTTREKQDFFIQRGTTTVSGTSSILTAGVHYSAPASNTLSFVRITDTGMTGAGDGAVGAQDTPDDFTAYLEDASDLQTNFTVARPSTADNTTRVAWEIVEYTGLAGADNEMIVRDVGTVTYGGSSLYATGTAVSGITDDNDVVVFITGQDNPDAGTENFNAGLSISSWHATDTVPVFERGDADGVASNISYAVVEFTGLNWRVQRVSHTYTAAGSAETEPITAVNSLSRAFLHAQKIAGDELYNLDEGGHQVYLSGIGQVSFQLEGGATNPSDQTSVAWIIESTQTGSGAMAVYRRSEVLNATTTQPTSNIYSIGATVNTSNASIFANNDSSGGGNFHPRVQLGTTIFSSTTFELWKADEGQNQEFRVEVVEWPVAQLAFQQNYYRFYTDNASTTPDDPWPVGASDLGENAALTASDDPLGEGERVRIRMNLIVNNASFPETTVSFKLQYGRRDGASCSAISSWTDVGGAGSGEIWRGYDATPADGDELTTALLSSDVLATYEEENNSAVNPNLADIGETVEYDWLVEHNGALQRTDYCFRMVESDGTELVAYNNYPTVRTTGYTPVVGDWRWYDDVQNETPSSPMAGENVAATGVGVNDIVKLRVLATEVESAAGSNVKFRLQYSQYPDFSDGGTFVVATSSCTATSTWCYADGAGVDNQIISTTTLTNADACTAGVGPGCGNHNEAPTTTSSLSQSALSNMEFEYVIQHAAARAGAVYYFRLYDPVAEDPLTASSSFPSLVAASAELIFTTTGLPVGTTTEGITTDVATASTSITFGDLPFGTDYKAAYRLSVNTNATEGYQVFMRADRDLENVYGETLPANTGSNAVPSAWSTGCTGLPACFAYHAGDDSLSGGSARFAPDDSYAALSSTTLEEVAYSSVPVNESHDIVFRAVATEAQPAGEYSTDLMFIVVPVY